MIQAEYTRRAEYGDQPTHLRQEMACRVIGLPYYKVALGSFKAAGMEEVRMKYAHEVIDLMAAFPERRFKMPQIINHVAPRADQRQRRGSYRCMAGTCRLRGVWTDRKHA